MEFREAMAKACKELGLSGHIKTIKFKNDAETMAERIAIVHASRPLEVKNSYMYLDALDFCFYKNGDSVDFSISGNISGNDKNKIIGAIQKALQLCVLCEVYLRN